MPRVLMNGGRGRSGQPEPEKKLSVLQFLCLRKNNRCFFLYEYFHVWNVCMHISMLSMDFCDLVRDLLVIHWVVTIQTGKCWGGILHVLQWKIHYLLPNGSLQKLCLLFCNPFCLHISYGMWVCALPCLSLQQKENFTCNVKRFESQPKCSEIFQKQGHCSSPSKGCYKSLYVCVDLLISRYEDTF